jgi:hypothetical protein
MKSRIPGAAQTLPEKLTVWGEPIQRPGSPAGRFISPMQISEAKGSPLEKEMIKLDIDIGYPSRKIRDYELPQEQYWQMVKQAGGPAKQILDRLASSPKWDTMTDKVKSKIISSVVEQFRDAEQRKMEARLIRERKIPTTR